MSATSNKYEALFAQEAAQIEAGARWLLGLIQKELDDDNFRTDSVARKVTVSHEVGNGSIRLNTPNLQKSLETLETLLIAPEQPWSSATIISSPSPKVPLQTKITATLTLR